MIIRAYIRLQKCTTNSRSAFVGRRWPNHGIAAGPISYYVVEGSSWSHIRRVLKTFDVLGASDINKTVVQAWIQDVGTALGGLRRLSSCEIPKLALFVPEDPRTIAPELTGLGPDAVEVCRPYSNV